MVVLYSVFCDTSMLFAIGVVPVYIPTNSVGGFPFLHSPLAFVIGGLINDGHSDWCEVVPHGSFFLFYFPTVQQGGQVILTCIHYIFPPAFLLLQHEYLDKVLNAIQQDLLVNLF